MSLLRLLLFLDYKMKYKRVSPNVTPEIKIIHQIHRIVSKLSLNHFLGIFKANIHKNTKKTIGVDYMDTQTVSIVFPGKLQTISEKGLKLKFN